MTLKLNPDPDAYGFRYGTYAAPDGTQVTVNIMPPQPHWRGDIVLEGSEPHSVDWIVYADGEEIGRVQHLDGVVGV